MGEGLGQVAMREQQGGSTERGKPSTERLWESQSAAEGSLQGPYS